MGAETTSKEKILKSIRKALIQKTPFKEAVVDMESSVLLDAVYEDLALDFAHRWRDLGGNFAYSFSLTEFFENLLSLAEQKKWDKLICLEPKLQTLLNLIHFPYISDEHALQEANASITSCEALVAISGSVVVSSAQIHGRTTTILPDTHLIIGFTDQLVPDVKAAIEQIKSNNQGKLPSMISFISGPSRTADIEKTLVLGAHGPKEVYLFLLEPELMPAS